MGTVPDHLRQRAKRGTGSLHAEGYWLHGNKMAHRLILEKALGHPLPKGAEVHHVNGDRTDNRLSNLIGCPDHAYHVLLHKRAEAIAATGDPHQRFCGICKTWDLESNMYRPSKKRSRLVHRECNMRYMREKAREYARRAC